MKTLLLVLFTMSSVAFAGDNCRKNDWDCKAKNENPSKPSYDFKHEPGTKSMRDERKVETYRDDDDEDEDDSSNSNSTENTWSPDRSGGYNRPDPH